MLKEFHPQTHQLFFSLVLAGRPNLMIAQYGVNTMSHLFLIHLETNPLFTWKLLTVLVFQFACRLIVGHFLFFS